MLARPQPGAPGSPEGSKADLSLDQDAYDRTYNAAGLEGYVTNMTASRMSADKGISSYQALRHTRADLAHVLPRPGSPVTCEGSHDRAGGCFLRAGTPEDWRLGCEV